MGFRPSASIRQFAVVPICSCVVLTGRVQAALTFGVSFDDPTSSYTSYYAPIQSDLLAAAQDWSQYLLGQASLQLIVRFDPNTTRAGGRSATTVFAGTDGALNVFQQGMASEILTGVDPNGSSPDGEIFLQPSYMMNELWFDPDPTHRSNPVPADRTDAVSVFIHELGHAFSFIGWRNSFDGTLPGNYESTFDRYTVFDGANLFFTGSHAEALYGGPVPITYGNDYHFGNQPPRLGADLIPDLMNGIVFYRGTRYDISALDLAVLSDTGLSVIPEPSSISLLTVGLAALWMFRREVAKRSSPFKMTTG